MAVRINSINIDGSDRFAKMNLAMSPVTNCPPGSPPSDQEASLETRSSPRPFVTSVDSVSENSCCEGSGGSVAQPGDCKPTSPSSSPTNNNSIPLNYKKIPSPFERSSWNSSPILKGSERDQSVSPVSSEHRPSPCPPLQRNSVSPSLSPSHTSCETNRTSPDAFRRSPKCPNETSQPMQVPSPFHENRVSPDSFKMSPPFLSDPMNPYLRLPANPFQTSHSFLSSPFLASTDPKILLNHPSFGLISQQLHTVHQLNGLSGKLHHQDLKDIPSMTIQQLQFLQNRLQSLPGQLQSCPQLPFPKFPDSKNQLSLLIQARKNPKNAEADKDTSFRPLNPKVIQTETNRMKYQSPAETIKTKDKNRHSLDEMLKNRRMSGEYAEESDSDELLSVGSESPPPNCQLTLFRRDTDNESDAGSSSLDCTSSIFSKTNFPANRSLTPFEKTKKYQNNSGAGRLQSGKSVSTNNRTLKFSIDNILKSDFGNDNGVPNVKKPSKPSKAEKKEKLDKDSERTPTEGKKTEQDKESPVDLSQDTSGSGSGEAPMLWPAWVYCTRYSDRPSSGELTSFPA